MVFFENVDVGRYPNWDFERVVFWVNTSSI